MNIIENKKSAIAKVGDDGYLLVRLVPASLRDGKAKWQWVILGSGANDILRSKDRSKNHIEAPWGSTPRSVMSSLVSFLSAFEEARSSTSENWDLFERKLHPWVTRNSDELQMLHVELNPVEYGYDDDEPVRCEADAIVGDKVDVCLTRLNRDGTCPRRGSHV